MEQAQQKSAFDLKEGMMFGPQRHFKLQAEVARIPLGRAWRVSDLGPGSRTSLSMLFADPILVADSSFLEALKKHINSAKRTKHQHLLDQQGFFQLKGGIFAIVQESLDGLTLEKLIRTADAQKLKRRQLKVLLGQIAIALDFLAKKQHTAHGALCPEMTFINRGAGIKLTGYGLRQALDDINDQLSTPLSYPHYQAPEAFHPGNISAKSDIYSLACLAYELLVGEKPFMVNSSGERQRHHEKQPRHVSDKQWLTLQRAFSDNPDDRPTSAPALVQALFIDEPEEAEEPDKKASPDTTEEEKRSGTAAAFFNPDSKLGRLFSRFPILERFFGRPAFFTFGAIIGFALALILFPPFDEGSDTEAQVAAAQQQASLEAEASAAESTAESTESPETSAAEQTDTGSIPDDTGDADVATTDNPQANDVTDTEANPQSSDIARDDRPSQTIFRDQISNDIFGPEMVVVPAGKFSKGDDSNYADDNEKPAHEVNIQLAFALSRYEVTFDEYDKFAETTGRAKPSDEGWGRGRRPVINVTWHDAKAYVDWLAEVTGEPYRLPTESEWEYASRAGSQTRYSWGDTVLPGYANCDECDSQWGGQRTAPVGSFKPNAWGLYDMAGNVDEWSADCYVDNYVGAPADGTAGKTSGCDARAMRSGSWFDIARLMRPSSRYRNPANGSRNSWGFRVALDLKP